MPLLAEFTPAGLKGIFAIVGTGWDGQAPMAFIGTLAFKRGGTVSGSILRNVAGASYGERRSHQLRLDGTFTIEVNGMGVILWSNGDESRFAPTRALTANGITGIEEFSLINRDLDQTTGALTTASATRVSGEGEFSNASLRGTYVSTAVGRGGDNPGAGLGVLTFDGQGGFSETNVANIQGNSFRERMLAAGSAQGTYAVRPDGTGVVADGGGAFVITRAIMAGNIRVAQEYAFIARDVMPTTGSHFTGITRRLQLDGSVLHGGAPST
jgi:hypothetical protein